MVGAAGDNSSAQIWQDTGAIAASLRGRSPVWAGPAGCDRTCSAAGVGMRLAPFNAEARRRKAAQRGDPKQVKRRLALRCPSIFVFALRLSLRLGGLASLR